MYAAEHSNMDMRCRLVPFLLSAALCSQPVHSAVRQQSLVYGKYFTATPQIDRSINTYYLYTDPAHDPATEPPAPVIVEIHGGGFTSGTATTSPNALVEAAVRNGMAFVSINYRLVTLTPI